MKKLLILALALLPLTALAEVKVNWVNPDDYIDPYADSMQSQKSTQITLNNLEKYMQRIGNRHLKEGQTLTIDVKALDLAGRYDPAYGPTMQDVRVIRSADFAHIKFDYKLTDADGNVLKSGTETLTHTLLVPLTLANRNEQAPYIRDLIQDWMDRTLDQK